MPWHEGDVCHKLRRVSGLTVEKLSEKTGLNKSVIYRLEKGKVKEPKRATISKIAEAFKLTPREFAELIPTGFVHKPNLEPAATTYEQARRRAVS